MGNKRVLLVTSAAPQQAPFSTTEKRMPIGVGYLISVLRDAGNDVFFIDNYLEPSDFLETNFLVENKIDFVGIYVNTICFRDTLRMLKKIEQLRKNGSWNGKIIVGGPHTTVALETIPDYVDFVVQGEGERAIVDIVEGQVSERVIRYPQIIYLDELPKPAWDVFAKMPYKWDMEWFEESPVFNMNTSRSCPFNCTFCSVRSIWGKKYTYFSAERVVDDVEHVIEKYGAKGIYFREDNFTLNKKRLTRFCELMIERNINIPWACESRVSTIDEESMELMARAGLRGFYFGVESGSQRILDLLHKDITVEEIHKAFSLCHKYNIKTAASMIVGIPGETEEDIRVTEELIKEIKPTTVWQNVFVGMPNSDLYKQVLRENLYEMIDDRGLVYLQGHNEKTKRFYGQGAFAKKASMPCNCQNLDMTNKPEISVLICVYNGEKFVRKTLESIYNQSFQDFEVIIVDDCSTDSTPDILKELKDSRTFIIRNNENLGPCKSANIGLGLCRGEYIIRSDADDISVLDRFEKQLKVMHARPDCVAAGSWVQWIDENDNPKDTWEPVTQPEEIHSRLLVKNAIAHGSSIIRKDALFSINGYDENFKYSLDYDLWLRLSEVGKLINIPELLYKLRAWGGSISVTKKDLQEKLAKQALANACRRRKIPLVTVITANCNTLDFTKLLMSKLIECSDIPFEIIVVDNDSTDGSREFLRQQKGVRLIELSQNIGHGPALDLAMKDVRSKYTIVIDSDAHPIHKNWMSRMIEPLNNEVLASGIYHHRNYVHPACMAFETENFFKYQVTFQPNWPKDGDISKLGVTNWDAGEYFSMQLLKYGKKLHYFKLSNCPAKSIVGSEYGGIVYHHFYGTRIKLEPGRQEFDQVSRDYILKSKNDHFNGQSSQEDCDRELKLSVVLTTYNRNDMLSSVLEGFANQDCDSKSYEVVVVDDGSNPKAQSVVEKFQSRMNAVYVYQDNNGLAAARNVGIKNAKGEIILFSDDDDIPDENLIAEHIRSHQQNPNDNVAVLGHLRWHDDLEVTTLMDYITRVGGEYLGYSSMQHGQFYPVWKWWGGLISAKKKLLESVDGPFDEQLCFGYEDTELACRLLNRDVRVLYNENAKSYILRGIDYKEFCQRRYKQGKALYFMARKHPEIINNRYGLNDAEQVYIKNYQPNLENWFNKICKYKDSLDGLLNSNQPADKPLLKAVHTLYRESFQGYWLKGFIDQARDIKQGKMSLTDPVNAQTPILKTQVSRANIENKPLAAQNKITFISYCMPICDLGSSNVRIFETLKILVGRGYEIDFIYHSQSEFDAKYIDIFKGKVNFRYIPFDLNLVIDYVTNRNRCLPQALWITNIWTNSSIQFANMLTDYFKTKLPNIKIIVDTMDFHYKKYNRKFKYSGNEIDKIIAQRLLDFERKLYPKADSVMVVSESEKADIQSQIDCTVDVIPNIHSLANYDKSLNDRRDLCFIGGMGITHNEDAVNWFIKDIFPLILKRCPEAKFHLLGFGNEKFKNLLEAHPNVVVAGRVENAEEAISNYRVFVCPLTYGAGMKGKLGSAAVAGTAIVTTTVGIEGFDFMDGRNCFIADDPYQFADKCVQLLNDDQIWKSFSVDAQKMIWSNFSPEVVGASIDQVLARLLTESRSVVEKDKLPKVSIITSCYNAEKFLDECVQSILNQTMQDWELFLVDDASSDSTRAIIERYCKLDDRIKGFYFDDNQGPYVRRNYAIQKAISDYIVIHDADDIMMPNKLKVLHKEISGNDDICIAGSFYRSFLDQFKGQDLTDLHILPTEQEQIVEYFSKFEYAMNHSAAITQKKMFDLIGLYDGNRFGADRFWLAKIAIYLKYMSNNRVVNIPQSLSFVRKHIASQMHRDSAFDPRGRRLLYQQYCMQKLVEVEKNIVNGADVCEQLRQCDCSDFLMRFTNEISKNQMVQLPKEALVERLSWAVALFSAKMYVNLISILDEIGAVAVDIDKEFLNFSLLKGCAYYALQFHDKAREYLDLEIQNHDNPAAKAFLTDIINAGVLTDPFDWCMQNTDRFNMRLLEVKAEKQVQTPNVQPVVSVIMPVYNAADSIGESIESVLMQSYPKLEIIIVDDGSTDETAEIIKSYDDKRMKYFRKENGGTSSARNLAIEKSIGLYIVPLNSDDKMAPDFITQHLKAFEKNSQADLVYCDDRLIDSIGNLIKVVARPEYADRKHLIRDLFRCGSPVVPFGTCIKREVFDKIGFYDEQLIIGEDYDMIRRFVKQGLVACHLKGDYYLRRVETNSLSENLTPIKAKFYFDVVKSFTESFSYEQLFPDVQWDKVAAENRQVHARFLFALTFMAIGQNYIKINSPVMANAGFDCAQQQLDKYLEISSDSSKAIQLIRKCKQMKSRSVEALC